MATSIRVYSWKNARVLAFLFLLLLVGLAGPRVAGALGPMPAPATVTLAVVPPVDTELLDPLCKATDLVILIDQSDSMRRNDPNDNRFAAAKAIVTFLGNHSVWLCQGQEITHRVAVIGFGDYGEPNTGDVAYYIAEQAVPPRNDFESWVKDRESIKGVIDGATGQYLGATDHYAALEAAHERLAFWKANPLDDRARRQSVILITDGEPCLITSGCPYPPNPADMNAIDQLTNTLGDTFPWRGADNSESVYISVIAMSQGAQSWQDSIFSRWRTITQAHGGDVFPANAANTNLSTIVTDIIGPIAGSAMQAVTCDQEFWIYPYTDNLVLIYAMGLDQTITDRATVIIDTLSEQIMVQGGTATSNRVIVQDYTADEGNEYYVFQRPLPGRYRLNYGSLGSCVGLMDVRVGQRSATGEVLVPTADAAYPATDPPSAIAAEKFRVAAYEFVGETGDEKAPLIEIEGYPLEVSATVTSADGSYSHTYAFTQVEDGIYESTEVIASPLVGDYTWETVAMVRNPNPDGAPIEVFRDSGSFVASEVVPFGFAISRPADGVTVPLNTVIGPRQMPIPIPVAIDLVDATGNPTEADTYVTDDSDLFTATLRSGDTVIEKIPLTRTPGSPSEFAGEFSNSQAGSVVAPGDYTIEVAAAWTPERYNPLVHQPATEQAVVALSQFEVVPLSLLISAPADTTLHEANWLGALQRNVQTIDFHAEVINAVTGEVMDLNQVLRDPDAGFEAEVVPPSGNATAVPLTVLSNANFQRLVAEGVTGTGATAEEGGYTIRLDTAAIPLQDNFAWDGAQPEASFSREDTIFSSPTFWWAIAITLAVILLALLVWLIYSITGGPTGELALVSAGMGRSTDIATFRLRASRRVNRLSNSTLANMGVKEIRVKRGGRNEDGQLTISTNVTSVEGEALLDGAEMVENQNEAFLPDAEIVYRSR